MNQTIIGLIRKTEFAGNTKLSVVTAALALTCPLGFPQFDLVDRDHDLDFFEVVTAGQSNKRRPDITNDEDLINQVKRLVQSIRLRYWSEYTFDQKPREYLDKIFSGFSDMGICCTYASSFGKIDVSYWVDQNRYRWTIPEETFKTEGPRATSLDLESVAEWRCPWDFSLAMAQFNVTQLLHLRHPTSKLIAQEEMLHKFHVAFPAVQ